MNDDVRLTLDLAKTEWMAMLVDMLSDVGANIDAGEHLEAAARLRILALQANHLSVLCAALAATGLRDGGFDVEGITEVLNAAQTGQLDVWLDAKLESLSPTTLDLLPIFSKLYATTVGARRG